MIDGQRAQSFRQPGQRGERDQRAVRAADGKQLEGAEIALVLGQQLDDDPVLVVVGQDGRGLRGAVRVVQRRLDLGRRHAECRGTIPIDGHPDFGVPDLEVARDVRELRQQQGHVLDRRTRGDPSLLPELTDVTSDLQIRNPEIRVAIDRDRAAALGVSPAQIESALYDAYGAAQASTILTDNNQYWVVIELLPQYQRDLGALQLLSVRGTNGTLVPLAALAKLTEGLGPLAVNHAGQLPAVTLSFNTAPGVSLGDAVTLVKTAAATLPADITSNFSGTAQAFQAAQQGLLLLLVLAIAVIYIVLGILYESFIHPLTILSGLPFAGFGALLALWVTGFDLSVYAFVGVIMLVGLVKKNAIMMIDFALEAERKHGKNARDAILEACSVRFRPIMMTTMAALMGTLPIALGAGAGAESRRPLGVAVVGGLAFSQLITLYVTPVIYTRLDAFRLRFRRG